MEHEGVDQVFGNLEDGAAPVDHELLKALLVVAFTDRRRVAVLTTMMIDTVMRMSQATVPPSQIITMVRSFPTASIFNPIRLNCNCRL